MNTVLITGANRSIGLETAKQLSKKGFYVYLGSRNLESGVEIVNELKENGYDNINPIEIDVTKIDSILTAKKIIESEQGKLDILINNAGISGVYPQDASSMKVDDIKNIFETNFFGVINVTQNFMNLLKKSSNPKISNITSGLGSLTLRKDPNWQYYNVNLIGYNSSKTALNAYTIALAHELKDTNFKVNSIDPGYTASDFNNFSGPGTIESAATFIVKHTLSDDNAPTGQFFSNDIKDGTEMSQW